MHVHPPSVGNPYSRICSIEQLIFSEAHLHICQQLYFLGVCCCCCASCGCHTSPAAAALPIPPSPRDEVSRPLAWRPQWTRRREPGDGHSTFLRQTNLKNKLHHWIIFCRFLKTPPATLPIARDREHSSEPILQGCHSIGCDRLETGGWLCGHLARYMLNKPAGCLVLLLRGIARYLLNTGTGGVPAQG